MSLGVAGEHPSAARGGVPLPPPCPSALPSLCVRVWVGVYVCYVLRIACLLFLFSV